jgi:hypothetical protein
MATNQRSQGPSFPLRRYLLVARIKLPEIAAPPGSGLQRGLAESLVHLPVGGRSAVARKARQQTQMLW